MNAGGTVQLTAGTYHVSSTLNLNGTTLAGTSGTTIDWTGGSNSNAINTGSNSQLTGVTLSGAGVFITDGSSNVTITNNTIQNIGGSTGVDCEGGSRNLQITNNTLHNIGGYAMVLNSINQAHVDNNTIATAYEGIHAVNFLGTSAGNDCTFDHNTLTGISRHGIEIQNDWDNLSIGWNSVSDFNVQPGGNSHIALSIATGPGAGGAVAENVDVHDNILLGNGPGVPSNPNYCFTAIEIMGDGSIINHNYIANWGWGVLDGYTSNWQVTNNDFVAVTSQNGKDAVPENDGVSPSVDTGNTWVGSWDGSVPSDFSNSASNGNPGSSDNAASAGSGSASGSNGSGNNGWATSTPTSTSTSTSTSTKKSKSSTASNASGSGSGSGGGTLASIASNLRQTILGQR